MVLPIIDECPFCGRDTAKLVFEPEKKCAPRKTYVGTVVRKYRFQVYCKHCHSKGTPVVTPYIQELITTADIPESLQDYAEKAIEGWNTRVKPIKKKEVVVNPNKMKLKQYRHMEKGAIYQMDDVLFTYDGNKLWYGDEGLSIEEWAELEDWQALFAVNRNRNIKKLVSKIDK